MQIHEITLLKEAVPFMQVPDNPEQAARQAELAAKQAQAQQQADDAVKNIKTNQTTGTTATAGTAPADPGAGVFGRMAQQLAPATPASQTAAPAGATATRSSRGGTITPTATGMVHTASERNPNPRTEPFTAQQKWDIEYRKLRNQFPGRTEAEYQQAMRSRTGSPSRPGGGAAPRAPQPTPATTARPAPTVAPAAPAYPPITLGTGPNAQVFVNKGQGYVDSKTGKPMPPAIVKALGV